MQERELIYGYWGKAAPEVAGGLHLLPYHCLDVTAVAALWWEKSISIRHNFLVLTGHSHTESRLRAWVLFFVALHDLGKFDIRFQLKAPEALRQRWPEFDPDTVFCVKRDMESYNHGEAGLGWFVAEYSALLGVAGVDAEILDMWEPWVAAVTGHHGVLPLRSQQKFYKADPHVIQRDRAARRAWFAALAELFLKPAGLSLQDMPPRFEEDNRQLLAGFCTVADWLGSNTDYFSYCADSGDLGVYFDSRVKEAQTKGLLVRSGLLRPIHGYGGIAAVLPADGIPQQVQTLVDTLPAEAGLTLIEAPTGSGKTEAALAYAWRLLDAGLADSIVFALPTQATANAMLKRLVEFADKLFDNGSNLVLAHGRAGFNEDFIHLKELTAQGNEEAAAQCAAWLAQSRKRVFLGQIGVCTIDQVLLSVLPLKHKFVRGFGVMKSVLIVDEVHAYDYYMYGLLEAVLKQQCIAGGSVVLLSATLPHHQHRDLLRAWGSREEFQLSVPYPLVTHFSTAGVATCREPGERHRPSPRDVTIEAVEAPGLLPDDKLLGRIVQAAEQGARVAVICNLVADAQKLARLLTERTVLSVDLFHARFRFKDRQQKEQAVLAHYGKEAADRQGRILVATQVVEQSLDLDFDWMITQLCPVDLLFQRLGRLHRHSRSRPVAFSQPLCTVLVPSNDDYGVHKVIYGDVLVLWRTERLLRQAQGVIHFPHAYREWIESVYQREEGPDEPETIIRAADTFRAEEMAKFHYARQLTSNAMNPLTDNDANINVLTRDGEMSLSLVPVMISERGKAFLDGTCLNDLEERELLEALNLNTVPVPASWGKQKGGCLPAVAEDGLVYLPMNLREDGSWEYISDKVQLIYDKTIGLEKRES